MQSEEIDDGVPREVRMFGYSMLLVHMQKLEHLLGVARKRGLNTETVEHAREYLLQLCEGGPDDPSFADWVREALEMSHALLEEEEEPAQPFLTVIDGGRDG